MTDIRRGDIVLDILTQREAEVTASRTLIQEVNGELIGLTSYCLRGIARQSIWRGESQVKLLRKLNPAEQRMFIENQRRAKHG